MARWLDAPFRTTLAWSILATVGACRSAGSPPPPAAPALAGGALDGGVSGLDGGDAPLEGGSVASPAEGTPSAEVGASEPVAANAVTIYGADTTAIENFIRSHSDSIKNACLSRQGGFSAVTLLTVEIVVGDDGRVTSVRAAGTVAAMDRCVEDQIRRWSFPASGGGLTFEVPFKLRE